MNEGECVMSDNNDCCTWKLAEDHIIMVIELWKTSCDNEFVFVDGTPTENGFRNCPYCGRMLVEKVYEERE